MFWPIWSDFRYLFFLSPNIKSLYLSLPLLLSISLSLPLSFFRSLPSISFYIFLTPSLLSLSPLFSLLSCLSCRAERSSGRRSGQYVSQQLWKLCFHGKVINRGPAVVFVCRCLRPFACLCVCLWVASLFLCGVCVVSLFVRCLTLRVSFYLSICMPVCTSVDLNVCLSICLSTLIFCPSRLPSSDSLSLYFYFLSPSFLPSFIESLLRFLYPTPPFSFLFSPFLLLLPLYYPTLFSSLFIPFSFSRFWTESYAMPRAEVAGSDAHPAVRRLVEMGFAEEDCRQALLTHKGKCRVLSLLFLLIIIWLIYIVITLKLHFFLSFVLCVRSFLLSRFIFALIFEFLTCCQFLSSFVSFFLFYLFFVSLLLFFFFPLLHFITPRTLIWFRVLRLLVSPKAMKAQQWKHYWAPCNARQKYIYMNMNMNRNRNRKGRRKSVRNFSWN